MSSGTRFGPYRLDAFLGAGGMGDVYRARDTRLDRIVALKVLPPEVASDPERRARFAREATAISQLSHPHICALYDVGEAELPPGAAQAFRPAPGARTEAGLPSPESPAPSPVSVSFLVMEYLEGETLAARLDRAGGAKAPSLRLVDALRIGAEIADALSFAHRHGIIHRDLKPANVMLTASGVKLLDFGLAKLKVGIGGWALGTGDHARPGATTESLTTEGKVLGTVPFMAPEQIEGKDTDARTDIFALGCVLYELVTGRRAFAGDTSAALMSAILKDEPAPLTERQPLAPPALDHVVRTCLAKDPEERWQSAADVKRELEWITEEARRTGRPPARAEQGPVGRPWRRTLGIGVLAGLGTGLAVTWTFRLGWNPPGPSALPTRLVIQLPPDRRLDLSTRSVAISPDGRTVVYAAVEGDRAALYSHSLDALEDRVISGTEGGANPFFSPNGQWLGFEAGGTLKKVPATGGTPVTISRTGPLHGADWSRADTIVFASGFPSTDSDRQMPAPVLRAEDTGSIGLFRVPAAAGEPELVARPDPARGELSYRWPALLPDGSHVLFTVRTGPTFDSAHVALLSLEQGEPRLLLPGATGARPAGSNYVVFGTTSGLMATAVSAAGEPSGRPVSVVEGIETHRGGPQFAVSASGVLVYAEPRRAVVTLQLVNASGVVEREWTGVRGDLGHLSVSPDGRYLSTTEETLANMVLMRLDVERGAVSPIAGPGNNHMGIWSPDGSHIVFSSDREGSSNLYLQTADGSRPAQRLLTSPHHQDPGSFSPDGRWLTYAEAHPERQWDLWVLDLETRQARPFRRTPATECFPLVSPDGRSIVYVSDESGRREVYLERFPDGVERVQVSVNGGDAPRWARDGQSIFFFAGTTLFDVPVQTQGSLGAGRPQRLLDGPFVPWSGWGIPSYDVMPDGSGFVMFRRLRHEGAGARLVVVQNWFEELKAKVPVK